MGHKPLGAAIFAMSLNTRNIHRNILTTTQQNLKLNGQIEDITENLVSYTEQAVYTIFRKPGWKSSLKNTPIAYKSRRSWCTVSRKVFAYLTEISNRVGGEA
jgi:hypothetical protein